MDELPWRCSACGFENMVDFGRLISWPADHGLRARGFVCERCGAREAVLLTNASLDEAMRKLKLCPPGNRKFNYLFAKAIRGMERMRGEGNGGIRRQDLASSGPMG